MLEAVVPGAREDPLDRAQLTDAAQPLELGRVDDLHAQRVERDRAVDHIGDDPRPRSRRSERPDHPRCQQDAERGHACKPESHLSSDLIARRGEETRCHGKFARGGINWADTPWKTQHTCQW